MYLPACPGNRPVPGGALDGFCAETSALCDSTPSPDDMLFWIFVGPPGVVAPTSGQWTFAGEACLGPDTAGAPAVPEFTARDFRRLPLPPGGVRIQPPNGRTLVNVPTNVYVDADVTVLDTTLLGFPVRVRATPARFRWAFGDGAALETADPGAPYPDLRTTHTYRETGTRRVRLVTVYTGEYSVSGGPWLPISGEAEVASAPAALTVLEARSHLVADVEP